MRLPIRTSPTPPNPSCASAPATAWPFGSRTPAFGITVTTTCVTRAPPSPAHLRDAVVCLAVARLRPGDHVGRQVRRGRGVVPADRVEPVAQVLLVERRRRSA